MFQTSQKSNSIPLVPIYADQLEDWLSKQDSNICNWLEQNDFSAKQSQFCAIPDANNNIQKIVFGITDEDHIRWALGNISIALPAGDYHLEGDLKESEIESMAIGWALGQYSFDMTSKQEDKSYALLYIKNLEPVLAVIDAITLVRDLINTPPSHMMPEDLSKATADLASQFDADFSEVTDEGTLQTSYPAIYAVGKASEHRPRLIKLTWGDDEDLPHLCLVGKGVCFDTGGLDLKPSKFMRNMKKDMGGGAHVLGLASLIMAMNLPIRLTVFIPAVDNAVSGNAFRPGDVINTRAGKTVEIDNTDAEGRLVLCDALTEAAALKPELIIDFATLTGAARVALGTEVPVFFSNSTELAAELDDASYLSGEAMWQLPLYKPYRAQLDSSVADLMNSSPAGYGGAITAALYLDEFVPESIPWLHIDMMAWNTRSRSGRPQGGEAMGIFAVSHFLYNKYSTDAFSA
ncbi:MAG: leucyl aminopeptidase family protein [Thiotrichaceae bacterium]